MVFRIAGQKLSISDDIKFASFTEFSDYVGELVKRIDKNNRNKVLKPIYDEHYKSNNSKKENSKSTKTDTKTGAGELKGK